MIKRLPNWVLTENNPAFYDTESKTAVEQTAKVYRKMQEVVDVVNEFIDEVNSQLDLSETEAYKQLECFKTNVETIMNDYIKCLDTKIATLDLDVTNKTTDYINDAIASGKIIITTSYDDGTESLNIVTGGE